MEAERHLQKEIVDYSFRWLTNWHSTTGRQDTPKGDIPASQIQSLLNNKTTRKRENKGKSEEEVERCLLYALTGEDEVEGDRGWIECDDCGHW